MPEPLHYAQFAVNAYFFRKVISFKNRMPLPAGWTEKAMQYEKQPDRG